MEEKSKKSNENREEAEKKTKKQSRTSIHWWNDFYVHFEDISM